MTTHDMPRLGVAINHKDVADLGGWILDTQRDIEIQDFVMPDVLLGDSSAIIDAYRNWLSGHKGRLGIHGPFMGLDISAGDPEVREVVKRRFEQGLDVAEKLGATHMVVHSPFTQWHTQNYRNFEWLQDNMYEAAHDCLGATIKRAEDIGCTIMLENINDVNPDERLALAKSFNSSAIQVSVDTGHAELVHGSNGAPPVDYFIKSAGEMLGHVHLQDADGYADRHWLPGEGAVRWPSVFDAIALLPQKPRLIIEVFRNMHRIPEAVRQFELKGLAC